MLRMYFSNDNKKRWHYAILGGVAAAAGASSIVNPFLAFGFFAVILLLFLGFIHFKVLLLVSIFALPFIPALNIAPGMDVAGSRPLIILLFGLFLLLGVIRKELKIPFNAGALLVVLFLGWVSLSLLYSPVSDRTIRKLAVFLSIFPLYFVVYGLYQKYGNRFTRSVYVAIATSSLFASVLGVLQFALQFAIGGEGVVGIYSDVVAPFLWGVTTAKTIELNPSWYFNAGSMDIMRAFSSFPDPHIFSYFLSFGFPIQVALAVTADSEKKKLFFYVSSALSLLAVFLTFSRGGYVGLAGGLTTAILCIVLKTSEKKVQTLLKIFLAASVVLIGITSFQNPISDRFLSSFDIYEGSNQGRVKIWREAYDVFRDNPVLGVGLGAYSFEVKPSADYREPIYAHNLYLELLAETGLPGFLLWMGIICFSLYYAVRIFFLVDKKRAAYALALLTSLVWFSVHSFFEMPIYSPVILPLVMVALATAGYWSQEEGTVRSQVADGF